jgi:hypothetical protein
LQPIFVIKNIISNWQVFELQTTFCNCKWQVLLVGKFDCKIDNFSCGESPHIILPIKHWPIYTIPSHNYVGEALICMHKMNESP